MLPVLVGVAGISHQVVINVRLKREQILNKAGKVCDLRCKIGLHNYRKKDCDLDSDTYSISFLERS